MINDTQHKKEGPAFTSTAIVTGPKFEKEMMEVGKMIFVDEICDATNCMRDYGQPIHKGSYRMMMNLLTEETFCPKCKLYAQGKKVDYQETKVSEETIERVKKHYLKQYSIFSGRKFTEKGMKGFIANTKKEEQVKGDCVIATNSIAAGKVVNVVMSGPSGSGKSHLSYSMLHNINELSERNEQQLTCMFIDFTTLVNKIKATYNEHYTDGDSRESLLEIIRMADVIVLDDVGAETGKVHSVKGASDHTYSILFDILNARDGLASTIITTNMPWQIFEKSFDQRITSRIQTNLTKIDFEGISDKRKDITF